MCNEEANHLSRPTIFSVYHHRSRDVLTMVNRLKTREWWSVERYHFDLFASRVVLQELQDGHYPWQRASIRMASAIARLPTTNEARTLAEMLKETNVVPQEKPGDALQMAVVNR